MCKNVAFVESPALGSVERLQCIDVAVHELVVVHGSMERSLRNPLESSVGPRAQAVHRTDDVFVVALACFHAM